MLDKKALTHPLIIKFQRYIDDVLSLPVWPKPWRKSSGLPLFLRQRYIFFEATLINTACLFLVPKEQTMPTPAVLRKHLVPIREKWHGEVVYLCETIEAFNRKRLIDQGIAFVVPGKQMYLPTLGIDLREHFLKLRKGITIFSPSTQAVVIHALLNDTGAKYTPLGLAKTLGYSPMTLSRVFTDLRTAELAEITAAGRNRVLRFEYSKRKLWEKAQVFMHTPVKKRHWVILSGEISSPIRSGLTGLAAYSMLAAPPGAVYAIGRSEWPSLKNNQIDLILPDRDPDATEIEIWGYNPGLFARNNVADPFSLYLSFVGHADERIESALEKMMETLEW